ncbi:phosphatidylserine decarboxylase [Polytolypa hystricis UAMH7299]|uniref:Phosphatidylserine decarboxylase proenzyme 1, mitochondrial n=1 Tax=Polytolypa hystricis (strain UAMH7299) TaxID=1447883 RepID=A0A2B7XTE4_POLH7|nr:phosphatidylserine decarboxylase [Polytolypa hystricis UAMH7299]
MSVLLVGRFALRQRPAQLANGLGLFAANTPIYTVGQRLPSHMRYFSSSRYFWGSSRGQNGPNGKGSFGSRLGAAWSSTKIEWKPIPVGLGIAFLGLLQFYKSQRAEKERLEREAALPDGEEVAQRRRVRPSGPWQVQIMSTLPLKALSRVWGRFNELDIPYYLRVPGFKLYSWIFGVNLDEMAEPDLHKYPNLAAFFYRELKPGVRPLDPNPAALLSPSDGRILQFGTIENGEVEQVKGMTYSLDALLGDKSTVSSAVQAVIPVKKPHHIVQHPDKDSESMATDEEFAKMNGLSYTLPSLLSGRHKFPDHKDVIDASTHSTSSSEAKVKEELAKGQTAWWMPKPISNTALYYVVIYLAPGDYHRFHSPTPWVVESRRHFAGELYSVSPYLQRTLPGLFTLNERVVLLGRWRWGFFSYTPVGATNVGSIKINFDAELRTNSLTTDTAADRAAALAAKNGETYPGFAEATYSHASDTLMGHALQRGEEMGGFQLGSSIVLVFEAPHDVQKGAGAGWKWDIEKGQRVKVGQALGEVV